MKKLYKVLSVLLAAALTMTFVSCAAGNNEDDETFGPDGKRRTTVRFYSFNDNKITAQLEDALAKDFYVTNPDIKIKLEISTGSFYTNLLNDYTGNVEADVFGMEPGEISPFLNEHYLEPLDDYFANSERVHLDDIWDINKDAYSYDYTTKQFGSGKTYAVMKDWTTDSMLLYNRSLFTADQLKIIEKDEDNDGVSDPMTFDEFKTLSDQLLKKSGKTITQYSFLPGLAEAKVLSQFMTNAGVSWFDKSSYESDFDNKEVQDVLKYYYDILGANEVNNTGELFYPLFQQGKVAMIMGGLYCVSAYNLFDAMDLGIAYPPVKDETCESKPYTTGCVGFAMSARSKVKEAAFKFIEWYLDYYAKNEAKEAKNFQAIKAYTDDFSLNSEYVTNPKKISAIQKFKTSLANATVIDRNPYCSQASFEKIQLKYTGEYLQGKMTFDEYWNTYDYEINKIVRQYKQNQD